MTDTLRSLRSEMRSSGPGHVASWENCHVDGGVRTARRAAVAMARVRAGTDAQSSLGEVPSESTTPGPMAGRKRAVYVGDPMKVHQIMTAHAHCVAPENTLVEAAGLMRQLDVGA